MTATEQHFEFLDELRASGITNMFGAGPYLMREFLMSKSEARDVLMAWQRTFDPNKSSWKRAEEARTINAH